LALTLPTLDIPTISITLRFFAQIKTAAGLSHRILPVAVGTSLRELLALLSNDMPALTATLTNGPLLTVVNQAQVPDDYILQPNDEVALLPPFSGGSGERP